MHQPILHLSLQHQLRFDLPALEISARRRRHLADGVIFEDFFHLLAALGHCATVVILAPSFIVITSGNPPRTGSSFTPGNVPSAVLMGGNGISRGSGPAAELETALRP